MMKAALIGLAGVGEDYLAALRRDDGFDLIAVADTNRELLRRHVEGTSLRAYEDYRSLIVETAHAGLELLIVALEPFRSIEFVELAASRGMGVLHKAPFARNVEEARRVIDRFEAHGCSLTVSRCWQYAACHCCRGSEDLDDSARSMGTAPGTMEQANVNELIGRVHAAVAIVRTADRAQGWRGDYQRAGGGVLLNGAYEQVDMLVALLGLPESVYAHCSAKGAPGAVRKYDTEDAATLSLRFTGDRTGSITAWRGASDAGWNVTLVGADGTVELCEAGCSHQPKTAKPIGAVLRAVTAAQPPDRASPSRAEDHLKTLAVIEAAYLSAKTSAPEAPAQFLE